MTVRTRSLTLLLAYAWFVCAPALHAIVHAEAPVADDAPVGVVSACDGPCHDPDHDHAPGGHDDLCPMCKVARGETVIATGAAVAVTVDVYVLARTRGPIRIGATLRGMLGARAPPAAS